MRRLAILLLWGGILIVVLGIAYLYRMNNVYIPKNQRCQQLKVGMSLDSVLRIMGTPDGERRINNGLSELIYSDGIGESSPTFVAFDRDKNQALVVYCGDVGYVFVDINGRVLSSNYMEEYLSHQRKNSKVGK